MNTQKEIPSTQNGFPFAWAEKRMDQMENEQRKTLFGREEKNLICNYAYHVGDTPEVHKQIKAIADSRFEVQNGYVNPAVQKEIQMEIDQIDEKWSSASEKPCSEILQQKELVNLKVKPYEKNVQEISSSGKTQKQTRRPSLLKSLKQHKQEAAHTDRNLQNRMQNQRKKHHLNQMGR